MPLTEKGEKIMRSMKEQYGPEKGESVFYASANKGTITGVHDKSKARDMSSENWKTLKWLLGKFIGEESQEEEHREPDVSRETPDGLDNGPLGWDNDEWSPEARAAAIKARQATAHLHLSAGPATGSKVTHRAQAGSHAEVERHLGNLHSYVKANPHLGEHRVSIENKNTGETHHAHVAPHGIYKRSFNKESFDEEEETKERHEGKLSETTRETIGEAGSEKREDMPDDVFLMPAEKKYPVKERRDGSWKYTRNLLLAAARRARMNGEEALAKRADAIRAREFSEEESNDRASDALAHDEIGTWPYSIATDKASVRVIDDAGRMHVNDSVLSKAVVSPYLGKEINGVMKDEAGWQALDDDKTYHLLRDPEALEKSVDTWNGLPLLWRHQGTSADDHPADIVIGATGTNARYEDGNLINDLVIWPKYATQAVEDGEKKSLSCGYGYKAIMRPGTYNGQHFDGRMVQLSGNHVALVDKPRVPGAKVGGDSLDDLIWQRIATAIRHLSA